MNSPMSVTSLRALLPAAGGAGTPSGHDPEFDALLAQHRDARPETDALRHSHGSSRQPGDVGSAHAGDAADRTPADPATAHQKGRARHPKKHAAADPPSGTAGQQQTAAAALAAQLGVQPGDAQDEAAAKAAGQQAATATGPGPARITVHGTAPTSTTGSTPQQGAAHAGPGGHVRVAGPAGPASAVDAALAARAGTPKAGSPGAGKVSAGPDTAAVSGRVSGAPAAPRNGAAGPAEATGPAVPVTGGGDGASPSGSGQGSSDRTSEPGSSLSGTASTTAGAGAPAPGSVHQPTGVASAATPPPGGPAPQGGVPAQVQPAVMRLVTRGDGTHRMTLQLHPADLGQVRVTVTVKDGSVDVSLAAAPAAQDALREGVTQLRTMLASSGQTLGQLVLRDLPGTTAAAAQNGAGQNGAGQGGAGQNGQQPQGQAWGQGQPFGQAPHHQGQHAAQQQLAAQTGQQSGQPWSGDQSPGRHDRSAAPAVPREASARRTPASPDGAPRSKPATRVATGLDVRI